jgi:phosphatidylinositol glycan class S
MSSAATPPQERSKQRRIDACINASPRARLWNILSYLSILLVGIPFWWHTTTIERRPLPTGQVEGMDFSHVSLNPHS